MWILAACQKGKELSREIQYQVRPLGLLDRCNVTMLRVKLSRKICLLVEIVFWRRHWQGCTKVCHTSLGKVTLSSYLVRIRAVSLIIFFTKQNAGLRSFCWIFPCFENSELKPEFRGRIQSVFIYYTHYFYLLHFIPFFICRIIIFLLPQIFMSLSEAWVCWNCTSLRDSPPFFSRIEKSGKHKFKSNQCKIVCFNFATDFVVHLLSRAKATALFSLRSIILVGMQLWIYSWNAVHDVWTSVGQSGGSSLSLEDEFMATNQYSALPKKNQRGKNIRLFHT